MSTSAALTANLLLSINKLVDSFPAPNKHQALQLENEALRVFLFQLQMSAKSLNEASSSLGTLISRKQRTIHFNADERFKKINSAITLSSLLIYQTGVILDCNPCPNTEDRANIMAGIASLQNVSYELYNQLSVLQNDVIAVI